MHELSPWSSLDRFIVSEFISDPSITKNLKYICYLYSKRCWCCPERSDAFFLAGWRDNFCILSPDRFICDHWHPLNAGIYGCRVWKEFNFNNSNGTKLSPEQAEWNFEFARDFKEEFFLWFLISFLLQLVMNNDKLILLQTNPPLIRSSHQTLWELFTNPSKGVVYAAPPHWSAEEMRWYYNVLNRLPPRQTDRQRMGLLWGEDSKLWTFTESIRDTP